MIREHAVGFPPFYTGESELLVLGSFPSVKSRLQAFYYGNAQNRFWKALCTFFGEQEPKSVEEKKEFLIRRRIALWDVITECEIIGSSDASIVNERVADIPSLLNAAPIRAVLCNGQKAYALLKKHFPKLGEEARLLPSTSPANPRFSLEEWHSVLREVLK